MDFVKFFQSKTFKIATWLIAGFVALFLMFKLGMLVGYKKAAFFYRWGENYHRNFAGPQKGFFKEFLSDKMDFTEAHGVFGQIIKIDDNIIIVKSRDNIEKIILIKEEIVITRFRERIKSAELKIDDYVVVIGEPNEAGQIEAKMIRVMPPPPSPPDVSFGPPMEPLP